MDKKIMYTRQESENNDGTPLDSYANIPIFAEK